MTFRSFFRRRITLAFFAVVKKSVPGVSAGAATCNRYFDKRIRGQEYRDEMNAAEHEDDNMFIWEGRTRGSA